MPSPTTMPPTTILNTGDDTAAGPAFAGVFGYISVCTYKIIDTKGAATDTNFTMTPDLPSLPIDNSTWRQAYPWRPIFLEGESNNNTTKIASSRIHQTYGAKWNER